MIAVKKPGNIASCWIAQVVANTRLQMFCYFSSAYLRPGEASALLSNDIRDCEMGQR